MTSRSPNILAVAGRVRMRSGYVLMLDLLDGLAARGHSVSLICHSISAELDQRPRSYPILTWADVMGRWPFAEPDLFHSFLDKQGIQLIHIHGTGLGSAAERAIRSAGRPAVYTPHSELTDGWENRRLAQLSQRVIALSEFRRQGLVNHCHLPREKIRVVMPGVEITKYESLPPQTNGHVPTIGTVAPLEQGRGQSHFLDAAFQVLNAGRSAKFVIAGDGREEKALRRKAKSLGIEKQVVFVTRLTSYSSLVSILDIFVRPAVRGGIGYTVLEAMAMGKAVLATTTGDVPELIDEGRTGLMIKKGDPAAMSEAIIRLLDMPAFSRTLGSEARESVARDFSMDRLVKNTLEVYEEASEHFLRHREEIHL